MLNQKIKLNTKKQKNKIKLSIMLFIFLSSNFPKQRENSGMNTLMTVFVPPFYVIRFSQNLIAFRDSVPNNSGKVNNKIKNCFFSVCVCV